MIIETRAYARAGLLGNPSDGYFGKTISISVKNFGVHISLYETPELHIEMQDSDLSTYKSIFDMVETINSRGYYGGGRLIKAAIKKFYEYFRENKIRLSSSNFTIRYYSSIPRQVGFAGSSAMIIATMRALSQFYQVEIPPEIMPTLALSAEVDELGINAGLQDRVIQTYEGCMYMDFNEKLLKSRRYGTYERLDAALLPKLYIAYKTELSKVSGTVLNTIRARFESGDEHTISTLKQIASLADEGKTALLNGNMKLLFELINTNFDLRCKIMNISESNMEMVNAARKCGASSSFCGSGGAIVGMYESDEQLTKLCIEMKKIHARVIKPYIV